MLIGSYHQERRRSLGREGNPGLDLSKAYDTKPILDLMTP